MDCALGFWFTDTHLNDVWFDDMTIVNVGDFVAPSGGEGVWFSRLAGDRHTFRRNNFSSLFESTGSNNQAYIMVPDTSSPWHERICISENTFDSNNQQCYGLGVFYDTDLAVIESNLIVNCISIGVGFKTDNRRQSIRGNWATGAGKLYDCIGFQAAADTGNAEISWNFGDGGDEPFIINEGMDGAVNNFYYIRNTTTMPFFVRGWDDASYGDIYFTDNVVVSSGSVVYDSEFTVDATKMIESGNLVNTTETNFLSTTTGLLIDSYVSQNATKGQNDLAGLK